MSFNAKVQIEEISPCEKSLKIEVPFEALKLEMRRQFDSLSKRATLPGFRVGKVPPGLIEQKYYGEVMQESLSRVVEGSYLEALSDHHIVAVSEPRLKVEPLRDQGPVCYSVQVEVKPKIELKKYIGLNVEKETVSIGASQVDRAIEGLRESKGQLRDISEARGVKEKDFVVIDFKGKVDGKEFPGGAAQNFLYEVGSRRFVGGFEEGLLGLKQGEKKEIQVEFPKDFHEEQLAGKKVVFEVELREIKEKEIPNLNDAFAAGFSGCKTVADLEKQVHKDLTTYEEDRARQKLEGAVVRELVHHNSVAVAPSMVQRQLEFLEKDIEQRFRKMGLEGERLSEILEKNRPDMKSRAEFDVQAMLLIEAVAEKEKIEPGPGEHQWQLLQQKVIQWLISKANVKG